MSDLGADALTQAAGGDPPEVARLRRQLDPYAQRVADTYVYERITLLLNTTASSNLDRFLTLPSTAPTRIAAVQVGVRLEVLSGTGRVLARFLDPQNETVYSFSAANGTGAQQDSSFQPLFGGRLHLTTDGAAFSGAYSVGVTIFAWGYLRTGL